MIKETDNIKITRDSLKQAHKRIYEVTDFIAVYILGDSFSRPLPIPQYNLFNYIDRPLIESKEIPKLEQAWKEYEKETRSWEPLAPNKISLEFMSTCPLLDT
jgi:hypothetical protein